MTPLIIEMFEKKKKIILKKVPPILKGTADETHPLFKGCSRRTDITSQQPKFSKLIRLDISGPK
jgi:hypothetical protein